MVLLLGSKRPYGNRNRLRRPVTAEQGLGIAARGKCDGSWQNIGLEQEGDPGQYAVQGLGVALSLLGYGGPQHIVALPHRLKELGR
ncbi:MAG: hypothetical protein FWG02_04505 [Holophagaceae bacterium]|nr:hypothetical protein [Holophagaceae bacterium]